MIPIDAIQPSPDQPRKRFDEDALRELADSIRELGLLQPIAVRDQGDGSYQIVAGERRWRAARAAGLTEIPVIVVEVTADEELFVRSVAENVNREDMTLIEEAAAYERLADQGWSPERIAKLLGKRPRDIRWRLDLLRLDPAVRGVVATGQVPPDLAWHLSTVSGTRQIEVLNKWSSGEFESVQAAAAYCEAARSLDAQEFMFEIEDIPEVTAAQQRARDRTRDRLGMIGRAIEQLEEIFEGEDLAIATRLGPDTERLRVELDGLAKLVRRLKARATKIEALHRAGAGQGSLLGSDQ